MKILLHFPKSCIFIALSLLVCFNAFANDFAVNGIYYNITNKTNKTVAVTYRGSDSYDYFDEYSGTVTIPSRVTYNNTTYSVTEIGDEAFCNCSGLTSITIPNSVTKIGDEAFCNCYGLTSITIPNSVISIGEWAFVYCINLTSVTIPNSVTKIGDGTFASCTGLTKVTIPNSVTEIGVAAFNECSGLTSITIPNSVTLICDGAFSYCSNLTSVTIPNSVNLIDESAFRGCTRLTSVTIPNSVTKIGDGTFASCTSLTEVYISDLSAWCEIDFGNYDSNPLYYAKKFKLNGTKITNLVIPNDITQIKKYAFYNCSILTSITIPNSVTEIGQGAFSGCLLDSVTSYCMTPPLCYNKAFDGNYSAKLKVPKGTKDAYANATEWNEFTNVLEIASIETVKADNDATEVARYDIYGHRLSEPTKGINIVKYSDGTTRKEFVK